jgi:endoglucanase
MARIRILLLLLSITWIAACSKKNPISPPANGNNLYPPPSQTPLDPFVQVRRLARCVNLSGLEAPAYGEWGLLEDAYFDSIRSAGFDGVRLPVRWSAYAAADSPWAIQPAFFETVDRAVGRALQCSLAVIVNMHHYEELFQNPAAHTRRFLGIWRQIAAHYRSYPDGLFFEILNEPNGALTSQAWNSLAALGIEAVRPMNPGRTLVIGPSGWNGLGALETLALPDSERNVIVTYHYYDPFQFTHQGAEWVDGSSAWLNTFWEGTEAEQRAVHQAFDRAVEWGRREGRPLFMGEFGAYEKANMSSRVRWTAFVARAAEERGIAWAYWEFCAGFGIYIPSEKRWNPGLLNALVPPDRNP